MNKMEVQMQLSEGLLDQAGKFAFSPAQTRAASIKQGHAYLLTPNSIVQVCSVLACTNIIVASVPMYEPPNLFKDYTDPIIRRRWGKVYASTWYTWQTTVYFMRL